MNTTSNKQPYIKPSLKQHGSVKAITQGITPPVGSGQAG